MLLPWILCGILTIAMVVAVIKNVMLKRSIDEIYTEFERCLSEDTNVQISVSSGDKAVKRLAGVINSRLSRIREMKQRYSNGDRKLKDAVTNISHDLRTPLTAIFGYLDLLEKSEMPEDVQRYVKLIRNRSEVLKQLTEELFRYSVITSTPQMSYTNVNLCLVLEETLISFQEAMQRAHIEPKIQMPGSPVWKMLDYSALSRIYGNIIHNAIKYSDGDFSVCMNEDGTVAFSNTSKELSTVEVGKLFDRFYTINSARKSTGLGLEIAKSLTERMNGRIAADYVGDKLIITVEF